MGDSEAIWSPGILTETGSITRLRREENAVWVTVAAGEELLELIVEKGSVCIDGVSLTVAAVGETSFQVSVIPIRDRKPFC